MSDFTHDFEQARAIEHAQDLLKLGTASSWELTQARGELMDAFRACDPAPVICLRLLRELAISRAHADRREGLSSIGRPLGKRKRTVGYLKNRPIGPGDAA